ncbi:endoplasmic reticulum retention protein [Savitreella phatthalungensis]
MNPFRFVADVSHLVSIFLLIHQMRISRSCAGISFKSQALYMLVYVSRYIDLLWEFVSVYNSLMKVFFIAAQGYILFLMRVKFRPTNDMKIDTFRVRYILAGAGVASLIFTYRYTPAEVVWSFSIWLESVAILPQLLLVQRTGEAENVTTHYLFALGIYRGLYVPNWIWRYVSENHLDPIAIFAGLIQTALYADFFYIYATKVLRGQKFELP